MSIKPSENILDLFNDKPLVKCCAPMVRYSKLQFRNLVKLYDSDLVFTPMILADSFCKSSKARDNEFTTNALDLPLVTQFAANTTHDFVGASYLVAPFCDGVDLNCGCPQKWARDLCLGCEMLKNPQKIYELVRECRNRIVKTLTVSVKMRIQSSITDTVQILRQLEMCGVSFVTIHSRSVYDSVGPICEESLRAAVSNVRIPIIGNGGLVSLDNCLELQKRTGISGVMVANGILANPEIYSGSKVPSLGCIQNWLNICYNSTLTMADYNDVCDQTCNLTFEERSKNLTFQCFHHHLVFMLGKILTKSERRVFNNLKTFNSVLEFLENKFGLRPKLSDSKEEFLKTLKLNLDYSNRTCVYEELRPREEPTKGSTTYDYSHTNGKYFQEIFIEND
ncbi:hypothetical protein ABEB36_006467 [Hypothenemus hampei]|uniref:DUS-like FMN-binding domain-containing protein n=1 Tax=Hypothenemus hampei TaxID=57062 RepID=A0ABD1EQM3_HYPHA